MGEGLPLAQVGVLYLVTLEALNFVFDAEGSTYVLGCQWPCSHL